jgi:hypothetical protein
MRTFCDSLPAGVLRRAETSEILLKLDYINTASVKAIMVRVTYVTQESGSHCGLLFG